MNCHRIVTASWNDTRAEADLAQRDGRPVKRIASPELKKLYDALGLDEKLQPVTGKQPRPIEWVKVHTLPDYTRFDHRAHVHAGIECEQCHGRVQEMERVRQVANLSMGWCVSCHREERTRHGQRLTASTDCVACHY